LPKIVDDSTTGGLLKLYDILLGIDGHPIADDSTIEFRANEELVWIITLNCIRSERSVS